MIKILGKASSINVRKVLWTCAELQLDFEQIDYGSGCSNSVSTPEFLQMNPNGMVPVLIDGDVVLWESNTICRYLVNRDRPGTLLPEAAAARAQVEKWMDWQATELNNAWRYAFMATVRHSLEHLDLMAIERSITQWNRMMGIVDQQLQKTGAWMAGEAFSLADIVIGLSLNRWKMSPIDRPHLPCVEAYEKRLLEREAYRLYGANGVA